ncbi:cullin-3-like [Zophobas morio]|uniref:cullin-3-like n=1 Tax=Zophobas morio TaxID=2755281 RepID=UPI003083166B
MYSTSLTMIRDILASLDRVYLEDNAELLSVYDLGLKTFYSEGAQFLSQLRQHLLEQITLERTGIAINRVVMKELLTMLVQLSSVQEFLYDEIFENEYLLSSKEYFQTESVSFITSHNVLSYLKKADVWFQEELERATEYMDSKTAAKVSRVMEETILISHFATLTEAANSTELHSWLDKHMVEELRLLYNLFSRDARGRQKLVEILSSHLNCAGAKFIENHRRGDALAYVQYFLDLKNKYDAILKECFGSDLELEAVYNQSFRCMLNSNSLFPKYFPYHINHLLQHTLMGRTEEEVERSLKKILKVLRFIEDKDIFEKYYRETLAKRLLADKLYSMEAEKFIILEIKHEFGYHFVYKLEGLLKDLIISNEIASKYRNAHILDFGLSVKVLTKSYWSIGSQSPIILHPLLEKARVSFDAFYQKDYPRRRLMWNFALGSVHLRVRFSFKIEKVLVVTPPQLNLLLAFEAKDNVSFKELAKIVGSDQVAREVLPSLCSRKFPILLERNVTNEKIFVFNTALSCAKRKVSLLKLARNNSDEHVKESIDIFLKA